MTTPANKQTRRPKGAAHVPAKRVDIVSLQLVREKSITYANRQIGSPSDAVELFRDFIGDSDREHFVLLCVNSKNQPTHIQTVSIGNLNSSLVHPREVYKSAIMANSGAILCLHNHPSDMLDPSAQDAEVTERLVEAGQILGIPLLDHIIVGTDAYYSFKEHHRI